MSGFVVFLRKELTESLKTLRLPIALAVFALIGVMNPMFAKLMPEIMGGIDLGGVALELPAPTAMDSWAQFYSNVGQLGMLTVIIVFSGVMSQELSRGTLVNLLTKGLGRPAVVAAKFAAASSVWALCYALCLSVTAAYTAYYWELDLQNAAVAFTGVWLVGELLIALLIFGGALTANTYGALGVTGGAVAALLVAGIAPSFERFNPLSLAGSAFALLSGAAAVDYYAPALAITAASVLLLVAASAAIFRRKRL
uniref:ABC transporter permease n=1 Tax=uncultured bacterium contig00006 TaxID=1181498 RepID=A0A806JYH2_9BACT|nr:hypothetical protein [uncultured bacterium contig00006]